MSKRNQLRSQYLIQFAYIGNRFHGLQPMPNLPTAGGAVRDRIHYAAQMDPKALCFSARTDSGVHALHNLATCWFSEPFDNQGFLERLRRYHPNDGIFSIRAQKVHYKVHARGITSKKSYRYVIEDSCKQSSTGKFSFRILPTLDVVSMQQAATILIGTHDFSSFRSTKCEKLNPIRTVNKLTVTAPFHLSNGERQIHIDITGEGFLRHMVRIIAGTLIEVGAGFRNPQSISTILQCKNRRQAGFMAPPQGLMLMQTDFEFSQHHAL